MPVRMTDDLQPENTQCWEDGAGGCHPSQLCSGQPVSAQGHSTGTAGQRPSTSTAPLQTGHSGYRISLILGCTSRHSCWSPRLDMGCSVSASHSAPPEGSLLQMTPHHAWREHSFLSVLLPLSICDCGPHENYVRHQEYTQGPYMKIHSSMNYSIKKVCIN